MTTENQTSTVVQGLEPIKMGKIFTIRIIYSVSEKVSPDYRLENDKVDIEIKKDIESKDEENEIDDVI